MNYSFFALGLAAGFSFLAAFAGAAFLAALGAAFVFAAVFSARASPGAAFTGTAGAGSICTGASDGLFTKESVRPRRTAVSRDNIRRSWHIKSYASSLEA